MAVLAVEMRVDPGQLMRTAEEHPELMDAVLNVIKTRAEKQDEDERREELRKQLNG